MYYSHLVQIVSFLQAQNFTHLNTIRRCRDNLLELTFDRNFRLYIDMQKSQSAIFMAPESLECKSYQAAFDTVLAKRFYRTFVAFIEIVNEDKVMRLSVISKGAYKQEQWNIDFEFTGKYTNIIITDDKGIIVEALRHIDARNSSREIRPGLPLGVVPKADFVFKSYPIEDVQRYLLDIYNARNGNELDAIKKVKIIQLEKQLKKIKKERAKLATVESLEAKAELFNAQAQVVLSHIHEIKPYDQVLHLTDFEGNAMTIQLEKFYAQPSQIANALFTQAKKAKQKAKHLHIEEENLDHRISFTEQLIALVNAAQSQASIEELFPKQKKVIKKDKIKPYEVFWFDGYKILLGRHAKANQELLADCKANDLWFHFKDRPSAHVVIVADKKKIPESVIEKAARLCVDFTVKVPGRYSIDYTKRKEVHVQESSNVLYYKYETMIVEKV